MSDTATKAVGWLARFIADERGFLSLGGELRSPDSDPAAEPSPEPAPATPASPEPQAPDPQIAKLRKENATARERRKAAEAEAAELRAKLNEIGEADQAKEVEALRAQLDAEKKAREAAEAERFKTDRTSEFDRLALDKGVDPKKLGDAAALAGADLLDADKDLGEVIATVIEGRESYLMTTTTKPGVSTDAPGKPGETFDPTDVAAVRALRESDPEKFAEVRDSGAFTTTWPVGGGQSVEVDLAAGNSFADRIRKAAKAGRGR